MYAIFLQDCIEKMCIWKKHSELDTHDSIYTIGGAINPSFEPPPAYERHPPIYNRSRSCFQDHEKLTLRRSNSAPPFNKINRKTSNPRAMQMKYEENTLNSTFSDPETAQVRQRKLKQHQKNRLNIYVLKD